MFSFAHMEPAGVVPSVVVISSTGVQVFSVTSPFLALKSIHVVSPGDVTYNNDFYILETITVP